MKCHYSLNLIVSNQAEGVFINKSKFITDGLAQAERINVKCENIYKPMNINSLILKGLQGIHSKYVCYQYYFRTLIFNKRIYYSHVIQFILSVYTYL